MIMPVTQAYVGEITPGGHEGFSMGLFNMSTFIGLSVGPLIGGIVNDSFSLKASFACMGFLSFIGFLLSFFFLPPTQAERVVCRGTKPIAWKRLLKDRGITGLFLFRLAYTTCIGIIWCFLPVFADSEFSLSSSYIGILVMLSVFVSGSIHTPMGYLADRVNRKMMVVIGGLIVCFATFSFEWASGFWDMFWANVLFGLGGGIAMPALMALAVIEGNKNEAMGSVMALITMAHSLGMFAGSIIAGFMMDVFRLRQAFSLGAAIMVLGVIFFLVCTCQKRVNFLRQV
jgi:MFS family permease